MFLIRQRYKFETNSQRTDGIIYSRTIVSDTSKIQIWNQFTTCFNFLPLETALFLIRQRYKFETNSQRYVLDTASVANCFWYVKDTNLKPIHNLTLGVMFPVVLFLIRQRYKFETNSQHQEPFLSVPSIVSDTSKIQIWNQFTTGITLLYCFINCFWYVKDTNLKPIHNRQEKTRNIALIVSDTSKIQIWNQFTTYKAMARRKATLFLIRQRYKFETNSQLQYWYNTASSDCFWYVKDTNLKPIHNNGRNHLLYK